MMDKFQRALILPFIFILIGMLAIMAQITNLNPEGIGFGLTGIAHFALYGVLLGVVIALPIYLIWRGWKPSASRSVASAQSLTPRDLIQSDSERVQTLTYTGSLESDQVVPPVHQAPVTPKSKTRKDLPFILPPSPLGQQVTQQVIIQPPPPGIGQGTQGNPVAQATPINPSPIKFRR